MARITEKKKIPEYRVVPGHKEITFKKTKIRRGDHIGPAGTTPGTSFKVGSGTATDPFRTEKRYLERRPERPLVKIHKKRVTPKKHTKKARRIRRSLTYKP